MRESYRTITSASGGKESKEDQNQKLNLPRNPPLDSPRAKYATVWAVVRLHEPHKSLSLD